MKTFKVGDRVSYSGRKGVVTKLRPKMFPGDSLKLHIEFDDGSVGGCYCYSPNLKRLKRKAKEPKIKAFKAGDRVIDSYRTHSLGEVASVDEHQRYPIRVEFDNGSVDYYTLGGKLWEDAPKTLVHAENSIIELVGEDHQVDLNANLHNERDVRLQSLQSENDLLSERFNEMNKVLVERDKEIERLKDELYQTELDNDRLYNRVPALGEEND